MHHWMLKVLFHLETLDRFEPVIDNLSGHAEVRVMGKGIDPDGSARFDATASTEEMYGWADVVVTGVPQANHTIHWGRQCRRPIVLYAWEPKDLDFASAAGVSLVVWNNPEHVQKKQWVGLQAACPVDDPDRLVDLLTMQSVQGGDRIVAVGSMGHYLDHLMPVMKAIAPGKRGPVMAPWGLMAKVTDYGLAAFPLVLNPGPLVNGRGPALFSSMFDLVSYPTARPVVLMEHGAGQCYDLDPPAESFINGKKRELCSLVLLPGQMAAKRHTQAWPNVPYEVIGCPKMAELSKLKPHNREPVVALSFHFNGAACPELASAWRYYVSVFEKLAKEFPGRVLGHAHPRHFREMEAKYKIAGIEPVSDFAEVLARASVYCCDNSSTIFEFASTDRPVVFLNIPSYRRDIDHGMRFWEATDCGLQCDSPDKLIPTIYEALKDHLSLRIKRRARCSQIYSVPHEDAPGTAARALETLLVSDGIVSPAVNNHRPCLTAVALRTFTDEEGTIPRGKVFYPGWTHRDVRENGAIVLQPVSKVTWMHPEMRMTQLLQLGWARENVGL